MEKFALENLGLSVIEKWDTAFVSEKLKLAKLDLDEQKLKPYFSLENVKAGVFDITGRLYGLSFKKNTAIEGYHPEVEVYEVYNRVGTFYALLYTDFFPRPGKRNGAWMTSFRGQKKGQRPHISIVCNFSKPTTRTPSLLTFQEVTTLFHEFGHALHGILANTTYEGLSGTNVFWDFVELPSQIMENWCWNRESLDVFARHHESGDPIPEELYQKMQAARNFNAAIGMMRQLALGKMDLELHLDPEKYNEGDLDELIREEIDSYSIPLKTKPPTIVRRFSHLFSSPVGYAAGYYSYKWAEVLDADAFTRFAKEGVFNRDTGMAFRECVLSKGNSEDPMELFKRFMGREPEPEALLVRSGLD